MPNILRNILAVIAGWFVGSIFNMGTMYLVMKIIGIPEGVDPMDPSSIAANIGNYETKHFLSPFLGHAIGTLVGAYVAAKISVGQKMIRALMVGVLFLIGGSMMAYMIPAPLWTEIADLLLAYIPMAYLGGILAGARKKNHQRL